MIESDNRSSVEKLFAANEKEFGEEPRYILLKFLFDNELTTINELTTGEGVVKVKDFTRLGNVIEKIGAETAKRILDALLKYMEAAAKERSLFGSELYENVFNVV